MKDLLQHMIIFSTRLLQISNMPTFQYLQALHFYKPPSSLFYAFILFNAQISIHLQCSSLFTFHYCLLFIMTAIQVYNHRTKVSISNKGSNNFKLFSNNCYHKTEHWFEVRLQVQPSLFLHRLAYWCFCTCVTGTRHITKNPSHCSSSQCWLL